MREEALALIRLLRSSAQPDWIGTYVGQAIQELEDALKNEKLDALKLSERQITCNMEHDICVYGQLQCDYNSVLIDIHRRRAEIEAGHP